MLNTHWCHSGQGFCCYLMTPWLQVCELWMLSAVYCSSLRLTAAASLARDDDDDSEDAGVCVHRHHHCSRLVRCRCLSRSCWVD